jgi:hypothetical protein
MDLTETLTAIERMQPKPGPALLPAEWSFHAETIIGREPLGPLPVNGCSFTRRLSGFGNGQVTVPKEPGTLGMLGYSGGVNRLIREWSWRLWIMYGGLPVWCGAPTGTADDDGNLVTLTLTELHNYLGWRAFDVAGGQRYTQVEQTAIARDLAAPLADVGVAIVTDPGPGFLRDRLYEYLEGDYRAGLLKNLAEVISGPQFRTEYAMSGGVPACTLRIAYPRVGGQTQLGVTVPGTATTYRTAWDADELRTRTFAVGELPENAEEGAARPVAVIDRPQADVPRLDRVDDWPSTFLLSTLQERAATAATQYAEPALEVQVTSLVGEPPVTAYNVGDDVTMSLVTPLMPGGLDVAGRLTECTVSAAEGTATWTVALSMPPPRPRERLTARMDRVDTTIAAIFRRRLTPL